VAVACGRASPSVVVVALLGLALPDVVEARTDVTPEAPVPPRASPLGNRCAIGASLWAGYTQQSPWQVYNAEASRPFRETHYQPEFMLAFHPDNRVLGFDWRMLDVAFVNQ
jgi:hypothetical protein